MNVEYWYSVAPMRTDGRITMLEDCIVVEVIVHEER